MQNRDVFHSSEFLHWHESNRGVKKMKNETTRVIT